MISFKLIVLSISLCLMCGYSVANDENDAYLLLFSLLMENATSVGRTILDRCGPDPSCINRALHEMETVESGGASSISRRVFALDREIPFAHLINGIDGANEGSGNGTPILTELPFDVSNCGAFPACKVHSVSRTLWSYTCDEHLVSFTVAMETILSAIIIISNLLIITVTLRTKSLRKPHGYFKMSLAVADLLTGMFVLPSIIHNTITRIESGSRLYTVSDIGILFRADSTYTAAGAFFGVMGVLSAIVGIYSMLLLSIDSFLSVRWPMQYRIGDIVTSKKAVIAVIILWAVALLVGFLPLLATDAVVYGLSYHTYQYLPILKALPGTEGQSGANRYLHAILYVVFVFGVPFVVTWVLTVFTSIQSRRMLQNMREARRRSVRSERALNKVDRELIRTVAVILSLFTITILPISGVLLAFILLPSDQCYNRATVIAFFTTLLIFICGRFLNVIIYNVFNKDFREGTTKLFNDIAVVFCCKDIDADLPKQSTTAKKSASFWTSSKSAGKSGTKETDLSARTTSVSAVTTTEKSLLSPSMIETTTTKSKLSTSSTSTEGSKAPGDTNSTVFFASETGKS